MHKWTASWSGATSGYPGLESLISNFEELGHQVKEHIAHIEQAVLAYFKQHAGTNGSLAIEASTDPEGEHSAQVTLAAIPKPVEPSPEDEPTGLDQENQPANGDGKPIAGLQNREANPPAGEDTPAAGEPHTEGSGSFVIQALGNGVSLVYGPSDGQTFSTHEEAEAARSRVVDPALGENPETKAIEITAEQLGAVTVKGLPAE